jgi:hypothetical protein
MLSFPTSYTWYNDLDAEIHLKSFASNQTLQKAKSLYYLN